MQESGTPTHSTDRRTIAILVVDVQQDFCAGGALAVPGGDQVVPVLNALLARAGALGMACYATRDWHPSHSNHFRPRGPWPVHCVAGTPGAQFHDDLRLPTGTVIVNKGYGLTATATPHSSLVWMMTRTSRSTPRDAALRISWRQGSLPTTAFERLFLMRCGGALR